jgi:hypothetical protein
LAWLPEAYLPSAIWPSATTRHVIAARWDMPNQLDNVVFRTGTGAP